MKTNKKKQEKRKLTAYLKRFYAVTLSRSVISVGKQLIMFIPEGGGYTSYQYEIAGVNTRYWGEATSAVVALFLQKKKAMDCLKAKDLVFCDPRWEKETIKVLKRVGNDHPHCSITTSHDLQLMPSEKWQ